MCKCTPYKFHYHNTIMQHCTYYCLLHTQLFRRVSGGKAGVTTAEPMCDLSSPLVGHGETKDDIQSSPDAAPQEVVDKCSELLY